LFERFETTFPGLLETLMTDRPNFLVVREIYSLIPDLVRRAHRLASEKNAASLLVQRTVQSAVTSLPRANSVEASLVRVMERLASEDPERMLIPARKATSVSPALDLERAKKKRPAQGGDLDGAAGSNAAVLRLLQKRSPKIAAVDPNQATFH
jgi:hypothetical protein